MLTGPNTEDPQGMLHVDAKGDTDVSQGTGIEDDVVVTPEGRIGLGTLDPQARLHIVNSTPGKAIRIADGSEGVGRVLASDAKGSARWDPLYWYATLYGGYSHGDATCGGATGWPPFTYAGYELFPAGTTGSVNLTAGTIKVPYTALYKITVSGVAHTNRNSTLFWAFVSLLVGNAESYPHYPGPSMLKSLGALDFGLFYFVSLTAGD